MAMSLPTVNFEGPSESLNSSTPKIMESIPEISFNTGCYANRWNKYRYG